MNNHVIVHNNIKQYLKYFKTICKVGQWRDLLKLCPVTLMVQQKPAADLVADHPLYAMHRLMLFSMAVWGPIKECALWSP